MRSSIFSSTVPRQTNLWTSTFFVCPMRNARSVAWFSTAGFHQRSKWITCEAAVRFKPDPPALSDSTKNGTDSSSWKRLTRSLRFLTSVSPWSTSPGRPKMPPRNDASGAVTSRNWVKTSAFSCLAAITSPSSRRRAHLPLSSSAHAPSPSHCEGWLQICLKRMRNASTSPLRLIPSASSSCSASSLTACW